MRPLPPLLPAAAAVVLFAVACGGTESGRGEAPSWEGIARTLTPGIDRDSQNVCKRGDPACLDAVVAEMQERLDSLAAACDHGAAFAFMYLEVTDAIREAEEGFFAPGGFLAHLDAVFALLYFDAFDAWRAGRGDDVPAAWRVAFAAADERRVSGVGDMLLGMNAHISRDLPFALASIHRAGTAPVRAEFERVNDVLERVQSPMLAEAARRYDRSIDHFSLPALRVDDATVAELIATWRTEAWFNSRLLVAARTADARAVAEAAIERHALARALLIRASTSYVPLVTSTAQRDRHCARQRRSS